MGLLYKLSHIGFSELVLKWFSSHLSGMRQCVLCWTVSAWAPAYAGVPRFLFLIFVNDIVTHTNCSIRLFADGTSLYIDVKNPQTAALAVNIYISTISKWALDWLIDFNEPNTFSLYTVSNK